MQAINQKQYEQLVYVIQKQIKQLQNSPNWECFVQGKVKGYRQKSQTQSLIIQAQVIVNLPFETVVNFFSQNNFMLKLNDMVLQNNVLYQKPGKYKINHLQMKTPFPMDNRQIVSLVIQFNQGNRFYLCNKSCNYPIKPTPKFVMAQLRIGGWIVQRIDNNTTKVINLSDMDPKGNIPDFLKNTISQKRVEGLKNLESVIKKNQN